MNSKFDTKRLFRTLPETVSGEGEFANAYGKTVSLFYEGEPYEGRKTTVFCYFGIPNGPRPKGGFPGIVLAHGGGGCAFFEWVEFWNSKGYAAIAPDFSGRQYGSQKLDGPVGEGVVQENPNAGPKGYGSASNTENNFKDSWIYHSVSSIIFAHNLLMEHPDVNAEKTVMTGISWGGVLTCITAGVDDRFCAYAPVYGCGYLQSSYCISLLNKNQQELECWNKFYDPISYLPNCKNPILFTIGADDPAFSIKANAASAVLCKGKVWYSNRCSLPHSHRWKDGDGMAIVGAFFDAFIKDKPLPYSICSAKVFDNKLSAVIDGVSNVKSAKFCYTYCEGNDSREWLWYSVEVTPLTDGTLSYDIPENVQACFFELSDLCQPELIMSTKVFFIS